MLKGEEKISQHGSLTLTNLRLIKKVKTLGGLHMKEIPIKNIDSISHTKHMPIFTFAVGFIFVISALLYPIMYGVEIQKYFIPMGFFIFVLGFIARKEIICFNSRATSITEEKLGMDDFTEEVRKMIYK